MEWNELTDAESHAPAPNTVNPDFVILRPLTLLSDLGISGLTITFNGTQISNCILDSGASMGILSSNLHRELNLPSVTSFKGRV